MTMNMARTTKGKINLIGIHGLMNAGKDTVAKTIIGMYPDYYKQYAFAWPIKEACKIMFNFTDDDMNDRVLKESVNKFWGITPRKAMQLLGTEYGRNMIREDMWVMRAQSEIDKNFNNGFGTVISDVRYDNEADIIRAKGGLIIHIHRENLDTSDSSYKHQSEIGIQWKMHDRTLYNNGSLDEFIDSIKGLMRNL